LIEVPKIYELYQIWPVMILIVTIALILGSSLSVERKMWKYFLTAIAAVGLSFAICTAGRLMPVALAIKLSRPQELLFGKSIIFDQLFLFMVIFLCVFLFGVIILSAVLWSRSSWEWPVFLCSLVGSLIGMIFLCSTRHLLFFAIAFELASMPSYVLVGFRRFNTKSAEGSAKYVIFGAVCSAIMLYGISLLYGLSGSFDFSTISFALAAGGVGVTKIVALVCLLVGIAFKISLVPMHFWCPDAFEAAGADVAGWLSVASKSAALIALARFVQILHLSGTAEFNHSLMLTFTVLAILTMTVANLSAYWQTSVKRLMAYSSIAHAGYMVCGIAVLGDVMGVAAIVSYVVVYMLMNLGAFAVVGLVERETGSDDLKSFAGLGSRNPYLSALMIIFLFSLVGIPPFAGFAVKWIMLSVLWQHNLSILVVAILANTLFSMFYYMKIARAIYFEDATLPAVKFPVLASVVLTICAAGLIVLFIGWGAMNTYSNNLITAVLG